VNTSPQLLVLTLQEWQAQSGRCSGDEGVMSKQTYAGRLDNITVVAG